MNEERRFPIYARAIFQLDEDPARFIEQSEEDRAKEAIESAKSAVMLAREAISDPRCVKRSLNESQQRLLKAQSKLEAVEKDYDSVKRRHNLIYEFTERTKNIRIAKRNTERHINKERLSKRPRHNGRNRGLSDRKTSDSVDTAATGNGSKTTAVMKAGGFSGPGSSLRSRKKSTLDAPQPSTATKPLRRSTRIAEREQRLYAAIAASFDTVKRLHQRTPKPIQMPTPPLAEPQEPKAQSPATKSANRGRLKQSVQRDTSKPQGISKKKGRPRS
ncbi:hypothetical protein K469DRAFT_690118 [Zopfia rhizophila CBS 207.26]|uniref:Uncharacterized protein n=1 Tax=Zopfia rhizophila CBS 207.26 TaxID=1314779 RepID=A0A6A6DWH1_9PEZI|nr:hypothetical protein K469DRAFT_690118 [Zopfia rhizophila CBS 207.26]